MLRGGAAMSGGWGLPHRSSAAARAGGAEHGLGGPLGAPHRAQRLHLGALAAHGGARRLLAALDLLADAELLVHDLVLLDGDVLLADRDLEGELLEGAVLGACV